MRWVNYNANGHLYRPEGSIIDNYTQTCGSIGIDSNKWVCKSFGKLSLSPQWTDPHYITNAIK